MDALDGRVRLEVPGIRLRENVYLGDGVQLPELSQVEGPAYVGNFAKVEEGARIGPHAVIGNGAVVKEGAAISRSVIDSGCYLGQSARVDGAIVGKRVDVRAHAVLSEDTAIGDECSIGAEAVVQRGVKVYPFKTIEPGAVVQTSLIWESRGITTLFSRDGVAGLINVDVTPDVAARVAAAYGTVLPRGARVVCSRDAHAASRMIKRSVISGLVSSGVSVSDLRVCTPAVARHQLKIDERAGGVHVRMSESDADLVQVQFFEAPGILASEGVIKAVERAYSRQELRRVAGSEIGSVGYPSRAAESYALDLLECLDRDVIRPRGFRLVLNYGRSPASLIVPTLIGELNVELIALEAFVDSTAGASLAARGGELERTANMVKAAGADLGVLMDVAGERIWLVDEGGEPLDADTTLLLMLREVARTTDEGALLVPVTETRHVEEVVGDAASRVTRTKASISELLIAAAAGDVEFAGASYGGYVFPRFLPAYDAVMSCCKVLELVAQSGSKLSQLAADLPRSTRLHTTVPCPWNRKGLVMRLLIEGAKDMDTDHLDGIRVQEPQGWVQALPDPDEPVFHLYAEGDTVEDSEALTAKYRAMLERFVEGAATEVSTSP
jgi:mannose-1-phosphate guanylyltransferase/phosphomannomutase